MTFAEQSWTDFLLQTYKCLVLPKALKNGTCSVTPSNIYSESESVLLKWMNGIFESERQNVWNNRAPATRWIVNFDFDLMDGLVLATLLAHFAPFLSGKYFTKMYTDPATAEQCLNNSLLVLAALKVQFVIWAKSLFLSSATKKNEVMNSKRNSKYFSILNRQISPIQILLP